LTFKTNSGSLPELSQETLTKRAFKLSKLALFGAYEEESTGINLNIHIILCSGGWSFFC
jgi:hypothetical protein